MASVEVLKVLGNEYNPEILRATHDPRSAQELSEELDVPIATCYRRIDELQEADLLEHHDSQLSEEHQRVNVYRRCIDGVRVEFYEDDCQVAIEERSEIKNKLDDVWRTLSES